MFQKIWMRSYNVNFSLEKSRVPHKPWKTGWRWLSVTSEVNKWLEHKQINTNSKWKCLSVN